MAGFKSLAKRKRELAKLDKRQAKDQRRALRRAARVEGGDATSAPAMAAAAQPTPASAVATAAVSKPLTLAEAVERWRNTKVVDPKRR